MGLLFGFGLVYNQFVAWTERQGYERRVTWGLVAIGCLVTIIPIAPLWGLRIAAHTFFYFLSSGIPMIAGAIWRDVQEQEEVQKEWHKAASLIK